MNNDNVITIDFNFDTQTVSARELHEKLGIKTEFRKWFPRMCEYGFTDDTDYKRVSQKCPTLGGEQEMVDYEISIDMAKEICMLQRTPQGKKVRQYLISLEKAWNDPTQVMLRTFNLLHKLKAENEALKAQLTELQSTFNASNVFGHISVADFATFLAEKGILIGQRKLFKWFRDNGYLGDSKENGTYNVPTEMAEQKKLFYVVRRVLNVPYGTMQITPRVTSTGAQYFLRELQELQKLYNNATTLEEKEKYSWD